VASRNKKRKKTAAPPTGQAKRTPAESADARARRQSVKDEQRKSQQREAWRRRLTVIGATVLVVAVAGGIFLFDQRRAADLEADLTAGSCETDQRSDPTRPAGQNHVPNASYQVEPPAGGDHAPAAARSGVYESDSAPPDGQLVHSLEHGYVIAWHSPELAEADRRGLTELEERYPGDLLVVERPGLPTPVAATAWGQRLLCQAVEPVALSRFVEQYVGKGPENVERG
jgi:hypothetical protein